MDITGFSIAVLPFALSPGASFTLTMSNVTHSGIKGAFSVIAGTGIGILIHAFLVGVGISQLLASSKLAMATLNIVGFVFLFWLGVKLIYSGVNSRNTPIADSDELPVTVSQALSLNIFNAKSVLLYLTVVPLFAGNALTDFMTLGVVHTGIMASWLFLCSFLLGMARRQFSLTPMTTVINIVGGLFLVYTSVVKIAVFISG
ncbi:hypothetical protein CS022_13465 [Veronia nyctiphanis]|uniref:Uncharacterized protein n=1 Tax=Veronia nyctiphanis TaxID=1278244 RepID=A0A4Q0YRV0_9GAMM|nr:LysE family translocator [Veronia nyctiphanis]RXJ72854.1 hypothetical protein CS022_13465 [Veronia nyctiphanis]